MRYIRNLINILTVYDEFCNYQRQCSELHFEERHLRASLLANIVDGVRGGGSFRDERQRRARARRCQHLGR